MKTATEIIETLYKNGSITFDEAITLSLNFKKEHTSEEKITLKPKITINDLILSLYEKAVEQLNIQTCIDYMNNTDWLWNGYKVTYGDFTNVLKKCITDVVKQMLNYIKEHTDEIGKLKNSNPWFRIQEGGISVLGYFDCDGTICIEPSFQLDETQLDLSNFNIDDVIEIANEC